MVLRVIGFFHDGVCPRDGAALYECVDADDLSGPPAHFVCGRKAEHVYDAIRIDGQVCPDFSEVKR